MKKKVILILIISVLIVLSSLIGLNYLKQREKTISQIQEHTNIEYQNNNIPDIELNEKEDTTTEIAVVDNPTNNVEENQINAVTEEPVVSQEVVTSPPTKSTEVTAPPKQKDTSTSVQTQIKTSTTNNQKNNAETSNVVTSTKETTPSQSKRQTQESSTETKKDETPTIQTPTQCTNNNNHGMDVGNSGQWFSTKDEAITYYNSKVSYWGNLWETDQIDDATYYKNCPSGYEVWTCMYCEKWTINFYYR